MIYSLSMSEKESTELYDKIASSQAQETAENNGGELHTWLIFRAGSENYAIDSHLVKEMLRNNDVYPVPFVPPYVKGLLNCYGEPYAIVDFSLFLGEKKQDTRLFMVLHGDFSIALQVSDILEFQSDSSEEIQNMASSADKSYFSGAIIYDKTSIPVLNLAGILAKIRNDLGNS